MVGPHAPYYPAVMARPGQKRLPEHSLDKASALASPSPRSSGPSALSRYMHRCTSSGGATPPLDMGPIFVQGTFDYTIFISSTTQKSIPNTCLIIWKRTHDKHWKTHVLLITQLLGCLCDPGLADVEQTCLFLTTIFQQVAPNAEEH